MVTDREVRFQNLEEAIEILNHWNSTSHDLAYQLLSDISRDVVIKPDELGQHPIQNRSDECGVLQVWVNSVAEVRGIALVSDVINQPERPWNVNAHCIWGRSFGQVLQLLNCLVGVELSSERREISLSDVFKQSECSFTKPATFDFAQAKTTQIEILLRLSVRLQQLVNKLRR